MPHEPAPPEISELADARAAARRARDWDLADELRARIETAGWKVIDSGTMYDLERSVVADVVEANRVLYGSSTAVPSRLDDAPVGVASVVMLATDWPGDVARARTALLAHGPDGLQVVIVANGPSGEQAAELEALDGTDPGASGAVTEVVWMSARVGHAAALNAGIRRASAPVVVVLDTSVEPQGDLVSALAAALGDDDVAVAGPFGVVSPDLRQFTGAPADAVDVDAIEGYAMAFRRADYSTLGPLDEHFTFYRNLDIWWSLVLRDGPADRPEDAPARRAVRVTSAAVVRHEHRGWTSLPHDEVERLSKKNFYRVLKRFASRRDLLVGAGS